jgi:catechol 2,3-dioxygenase-like lactoylglutathione lyase family enzyme
MLHVSDAAQAEHFFCAGLGFEKRFEHRADKALADPSYKGLARDGVMLHVSSFGGDGVAGGVVNLLVDDVDALHDEFRSRGVPIAMPPTDQTWGNREMYVKDADGNTLRFIQEG